MKIIPEFQEATLFDHLASKLLPTPEPSPAFGVGKASWTMVSRWANWHLWSNHSTLQIRRWSKLGRYFFG